MRGQHHLVMESTGSVAGGLGSRFASMSLISCVWDDYFQSLLILHKMGVMLISAAWGCHEDPNE